MKSLSLAAFAVALAPAAFALSPQADEFVRSIKPPLNPAEVAIAESHGEVKTTFQGDPKTFTLEELALQRGQNQVTRFVATRAFVERLSNDFAGTPMLRKNYEALYLTPQERQLVGRKIADSL